MSEPQRKRVDLALQGGGAHGAFTWGVLDAFLDDGRLDVVAISGTSAGAMNAVAFADGLREGGVNGARSQLERFWRGASVDGNLSEDQRKAVGLALGFGTPSKCAIAGLRRLPTSSRPTISIRSTSISCATRSDAKSIFRRCARARGQNSSLPRPMSTQERCVSFAVQS